MYATPGASMYLPAGAATTTMAAPSILALPSMVAAPSVVETVAPMAYAAPTPAIAAGFGVPAPVSLTAGLPDPKKIEAEKAAYGTALEQQLDKQAKAVMQEADIKKKMLAETAK